MFSLDKSLSLDFISDMNPGALSVLTEMLEFLLIVLVVTTRPSFRSSAFSDFMREVATKSEKESHVTNINCFALLKTSETNLTPGEGEFVIDVKCLISLGIFCFALQR